MVSYQENDITKYNPVFEEDSTSKAQDHYESLDEKYPSRAWVSKYLVQLVLFGGGWESAVLLEDMHHWGQTLRLRNISLYFQFALFLHLGLNMWAFSLLLHPCLLLACCPAIMDFNASRSIRPKISFFYELSRSCFLFVCFCVLFFLNKTRKVIKINTKHEQPWHFQPWWKEIYCKVDIKVNPWYPGTY